MQHRKCLLVQNGALNTVNSVNSKRTFKITRTGYGQAARIAYYAMAPEELFGNENTIQKLLKQWLSFKATIVGDSFFV